MRQVGDEAVRQHQQVGAQQDLVGAVDGRRRVGGEPQPGVRRLLGEQGGEGVAEDRDPVVADQQGELPGRGRRVEVRLGGENPLDAGEREPGEVPSCTASGVSRYSLPTRVSSSSPKCRRSRASDADSAGWLRPICAAARVTLRCWSSASRDTSRFRSRLARFTATTVSTRLMPVIRHLVFPHPCGLDHCRRRARVPRPPRPQRPRGRDRRGREARAPTGAAGAPTTCWAP